MRGETKNILKVAFIYMSTIVGAGFASGQEIVRFFTSYYRGGFYGIILAGILFAIIGALVLNRVYTERIQSFDEFLYPTVGPYFGRIMEIINSLFLLSLFCIMVAGMGNVLHEEFNIPYHICILIVVLVCMGIILTDIQGIISLGTIVSPVLIIGIIAVGLYILRFKEISVFKLYGLSGRIVYNWVFSSLLYVSYNSLISIVVMCKLLPYLKSKTVGVAGGILGGALLCFTAFILNMAIFLFSPRSLAYELPVLNLAESHSSLLGAVYSVILGLAMLVSAATSGYCIADRISSKIRVNVKLLTCALCLLAIPLANVGFSNLISTIYPVFGYAGLFMIFAFLIQEARGMVVKKMNR